MAAHVFIEDKTYCVVCGLPAGSPAMLYPCPGDAHEPEDADEALEALIKTVDAMIKAVEAE